MGTHIYFQHVGVGEKIQLLGEEKEEKLSVDRHFSLQMAVAVGQQNPLVGNNLEELHTCFLEEVEEKEDLFS